jgi:hypothetical protein
MGRPQTVASPVASDSAVAVLDTPLGWRPKGRAGRAYARYLDCLEAFAKTILPCPGDRWEVRSDLSNANPVRVIHKPSADVSSTSSR